MKLLILLIAINTISAKGFKQTAEKFLEEKFGNDAKIKFTLFQIPKEKKVEAENSVHQKFFRDKIYSWEIVKNDKIIARAFVDNVFGRFQPITFLLVISKEGKILYFEILKYRSDHGGNVKEIWWRNQFIGKNVDSDFTVGKEIQAVSGATISVNSLTRGIKKLLLINK